MTQPIPEAQRAGLALLVERMAGVGALDYSYESLDVVAEFFLSHLEDRFDAGVATYVGQTIIAKTGASWSPPGPDDLKKWVIVKLPQLAGVRFPPASVVMRVRRSGTSRELREFTERHDIALRRTRLAELLAARDQELAGLRDDLQQLDVKLGNDNAAVDAIEDGIKALRTKQSSPAVARRVRERMVLWLGTRLERETKRPWTVCTEGSNPDVGRFCVDDWAPEQAMYNIGLKTKPGLLAEILARRIEDLDKR